MILFLGVSFTFNSLAQGKSKDGKKETQTVEQKSNDKITVDSTKAFNTICPVSTEDIDPEVTYTYKGKTYALCCNNCLKKFKKDPEKYISRLSEDGKSIVKKKSE
jgi:YHS domain-containing protein